MGEKIRDLNEITVGSNKLMIELNEGYLKEQGRVIHVQNKHFRYLLKENDFLKLASEILRAKSELDYMRNCYSKKGKIADFKSKIHIQRNSGEHVYQISNLLQINEIDYRVIECGAGYVSILLHYSDYAKLKMLCKRNREISVLWHPYGKMFGYSFIYQMNPFELIKFKNTYYEFMFQLPCASLTPKTWIPLDRVIQELAWNNKDLKGEIYYLDDISFYIYRVCWAVFKDKNFSEKTKTLLENLQDHISWEVLYQYMKLVFFSYTSQLISLLQDKRYDEIITDYFMFDDY